MSAKSEAKYVEKWMRKAESLGKEPPKPGDARYNLEDPEQLPAGPGESEQLNLKVPKGTKVRLKRLGLEQGGVSMLTIFKRMLDQYEAHHRAKQKG
jgi:hypothetical protein